MKIRIRKIYIPFPLVEQHLKSKCHQIALEIENGKPSNERATDIPGPQTPVDMPMDHASTPEAYVHLMNAAYQLALNPTMSVAARNDDNSSPEELLLTQFR